MLIARNISRVDCPKLTKVATFKPQYFQKKITVEIFFTNLSSGQQYLLHDIEMASEKVKFCLKKKNHPEHKYSVTFVNEN